MGNPLSVCAGNTVSDVEDLKEAAKNRLKDKEQEQKAVKKKKRPISPKLESQKTRNSVSTVPDSQSKEPTEEKPCSQQPDYHSCQEISTKPLNADTMRVQLRGFAFGSAPSSPPRYSEEDKMKDLRMLRKTFGHYYKDLPLVKAVIETPVTAEEAEKRKLATALKRKRNSEKRYKSHSHYRRRLTN